MNIDEFCNFLGISKPTIYNWKKDKPNLHNIVMDYKKNIIDNEGVNENDIVKLFNKLSKEEKEMYIHEIKARILKKELDK